MDYEYFNSVLDALLQLAEEHPEMSPEELLSQKADEWNLDEKVLSEISESGDVLDSIDDKVKELESSGNSRDSFINKDLSRMTEGRSEKEKEAVSEAIQSVLGKEIEPDKQ